MLFRMIRWIVERMMAGMGGYDWEEFEYRNRQFRYWEVKKELAALEARSVILEADQQKINGLRNRLTSGVDSAIIIS